MRVAALYDIHGNLPALEAVLREVRAASADLVVVGGDVLPGPMPGEVLACLADFDAPVRFIRGNGDRIVDAHLSGGDLSEVPEPYRPAIHWTAAQLDAGQRAALREWPSALELDLAGLGPTLFCHATPRSDVECFTRTTPVERLLPVFAGIPAAIVVCGHTHMPFDRTVGRHRILNAGSIGMPFAPPRGAHWLLLGPGIDPRRTDYDFEAAADRIRATGYPQAETAVVPYVLHPPREADSLRMFAGVEIA